MELWIKNQDNDLLIKVDRIGIEKFDDGYGIVTYERIGTKKEFGLGLYTTKERALEVLDEIQNILKPQMVLSKVGKLIAETCDGTVYREPDEYDIKEISTYVYEMPKE